MPIRLNAWTAAWRLIGYEIVCVECKRRQSLSDADSDFEHEPGCAADPKKSEIAPDTPVSRGMALTALIQSEK